MIYRSNGEVEIIDIERLKTISFYICWRQKLCIFFHFNKAESFNCQLLTAEKLSER